MSQSVNCCNQDLGALGYRRLRQSKIIRDSVKQVRLSKSQLMQPLFVVEGIAQKEVIPGLTGVYRDTMKTILTQIESDLKAGVKQFLLFGVPKGRNKNPKSFDFTASAIAAIKKKFGDRLFLAVDVCLCSSTPHGHCGILNAEGDHVLNSQTVEALSAAALAYAKAGADCVAPSDMMDGRIAAIRTTLDENGFDRTLLMSYSAKFHSKFYGPFRVAADSAPKGELKLKDRATYQIDPARPNDALLCSERDDLEGADILMVKPGMPYLDILADLSKKILKPWAVYEVSGEFAAIELMAQNGLIQKEAAHVEAWTAFVRAGASIIITYGARYADEYFKVADSI